MTKEDHDRIEDAIVVAIEDFGMTKEEMLQNVTDQYKVSPILVLQMYEEMYGE